MLPSPSDALLRVEDLASHGRGCVSFSLRPEEVVTISGPSGAGKSLLLRAIADLDINRGEAWIGGAARSAMPAHVWRRHVTLLPAEPMWWHDTVGEHFDGLPWGLERLGFGSEVMIWSVARLSSGERQRLALLRLFAGGPKALLLDEPTANLDDENTARVEALIADYLHEHGACALWVSHLPVQRERVAKRELQVTAEGLREVRHR